MTEQNNAPIPRERLQVLMNLAKRFNLSGDALLGLYQEHYHQETSPMHVFNIKVEKAEATLPRIYRLTNAALYRILNPDFDASAVLDPSNEPAVYCAVTEEGFFSLAPLYDGWSWKVASSLPLGELRHYEITHEAFQSETSVPPELAAQALRVLIASGAQELRFTK